MLRPFVYRKYLDYTAFAGLRDMKARIDAEVARKDLSENLKQGPGGIREIEFVVQLEQLIRGGRDPSLRVRGLLPALEACEARGYIPGRRARRLREAWAFLRHLENRVQMLRDAQTHDIPDDPDAARRAWPLGLGYADWDALATELAAPSRRRSPRNSTRCWCPTPGVHAAAPARERALWRGGRRTAPGRRGSCGRAASQDGAALADALNTLSQAPRCGRCRRAAARAWSG